MQIKVRTAGHFKSRIAFMIILGILFVPVLFFCIDPSYFTFPEFLKALGLKFWLFIFVAIPILVVRIITNAKEPEIVEFGFNNDGVYFVRKLKNKKISEHTPYNSIKKLNLTIKSKEQDVVTQRSYTTVALLQGVDLVFIFSDGETVSINLGGKIDYIYKILAYRNNFKKFEYSFEGPDDEELQEKINYYLENNKILILNKNDKIAVAYIAAIASVIIGTIIVSAFMKSWILEKILENLALLEKFAAVIMFIGPVVTVAIVFIVFKFIEKKINKS